MHVDTSFCRALLFGLACVVFGGIPALADGGADHQAAQAWPIQLGTSGGNINDISTLYCCAGTLGALVEDAGGVQYILSNNHVLGRSNLAVVGDPVNQPGMIDQNCQQNGVVANFSQLIPLQFAKGRVRPVNLVDSAMAQAIAGAVSSEGLILDIGPISGSTLSVVPGMAVQKSGRTTGHTIGVVQAIDVSVSVGYSKECGGAANQVAYFQNQIRIGDGTFSDSGDSGSLILESGTADSANGLPRAVGLLFAGDSSSTLANGIGNVLSALNVSMVEGTPVPPGPVGATAGTVSDSTTSLGVAGAIVSVGSLTATTDAAGNYSLTNVPAGTVTVNVSAMGYYSDSQGGVTVIEDQTSFVDFQLAPRPEPTVVSPECITYETSGGKTGDRNLLVSVLAVDDFGSPVAGAVVNISLTLNGAAYASGTGASTGANGVVTYQARNAPNGTYVTTVTGIQASGLAFSGSATTPINSFAKGSDTVPAQFCNAGASSTASTGQAGTLARARAANARNAARLIALDGVVGHGVGAGANNGAVIEIYVLNSAGTAARGNVPRDIEGIPVRIVETDGFIAY